MRDPHPLAIIPLSNGNGGTDNSSSDLPIRALVPHNSSGLTTAATERDEPRRSEDDTALMRSLINLMPHERADSQFSVTSPIRRRDASDEAMSSWFRSRRPNRSAFGRCADGSAESESDNCGGSCSTSDSGIGGDGAGHRRQSRGGRDGNSGGGLDFLGTTDSVRDLFHLPYTSEAVTVGLHRVGKTLVLDGNLDEVLVPAAAAAAAADKAPAPAPSPPSSSTVSSATNPARGSSDGINNTMIGGGEREGRWVMVGKRGKPQQRVTGEGEGQGWRNDEDHSECVSAGNSMTPSRVPQGERWIKEERDRKGVEGEPAAIAAPTAAALPPRRNRNRGWEDGLRSGGLCGQGVDPDVRRARVEQLSRSPYGGGSEGAIGGRDWSGTNETNWPALGAPDTTSAAASSSGEDVALLAPDSCNSGGILSIVPSRPRAQSFGVQPPEPTGFRRSFQWELAGMHLMLGSSLPVCSTSEHPQVSVRLHDGDEDLSLCTCLDYYLDNIMESVPELALCMREKGYIQGCRVVSTEDIPYLGSLLKKSAAAHDAATAATATTAAEAGAQDFGAGAPVPMFDPDVVELNATILLRFLQENCSREGGTYLLHRSEGATHVQLYDVSALSKQRHRRWKWLLAMLCYRFALRISHHTRQLWGRRGWPGTDSGGRGQSTSRGPVDISSSPEPEVLRQLLRRQRQLLENSLELLEELAELGGGGHETICASVQEHIADTYLGYGGTHIALQGPSSGGRNGGPGNTESLRRRPRRGQGEGSSESQVEGVEPTVSGREALRAPWTIDSEGEVRTSPGPSHLRGKTSGAANRKGKNRRDAQSRSAGGRRNEAPGDDLDAGGNKGGSHPECVRLGGDDLGSGQYQRGAGPYSSGAFSAERQREENLDKAQDHLTSGIAILRGVMARQESAAAGRDGRDADVVIVGESKRPVAIMRQKQNPWLAVDDDEDDSEEFEEEEQDNVGKDVLAGEQGQMNGGESADTARLARSRRRRRASQDESEDPATALSVVSEQLWGLQQKLVGTYMAVARARLGRAFPDPPIVMAGINAPKSGARRTTVEMTAARHEREAGPESGNAEDGPDEETRVELVQGALDSLCAAWEHLVEAKNTLDRRSAAVLAGEEGENRVKGGVENGKVRSVGADENDLRGTNGTQADRGSAASRERAEKLGPLWKGSLSEALAQSGDESGSSVTVSVDDTKAARNSASASTAVVDGNVPTTDQDVMGRMAWTRAAYGQLESRRAELFELCGDVAHACVSLRTRTITAGISMASSDSTAEAQRSLPIRLQELLSSTRPPLKLEDLDVCQVLHGNVWKTLSGSVGYDGSKTGAKGRGSTSGKRGRGPNKSRAQPTSRSSVSLSTSDGVKAETDAVHCESDGTESMEDPPLLAETCVHSLAKAGRAPGDPTAWSLCLAAEGCYKRALLDLDKVGGVLLPESGTAVTIKDDGPGGNRLDPSGTAFTGVPKARARIRKKLGDASNELGKLMAQCAGVLVQTPPPPPPTRSESVDTEATQSTPSATPGASTLIAAHTSQHPGLGCAMCVACAERWFRLSLAQFREIGDARNTALLLCNLASVERLKPRALGRLREACPTLTSLVEGGDGGTTAGGKTRTSSTRRGAAAAVALCMEAHATIGRREEDERIWDHASGELAMSHLCLGVERRQELLATLLGKDTDVGAVGMGLGSSVNRSEYHPPTAAQVRGIVGPLEQALQIYTDMKNAPQAAACHYQIGQYYAKILPAYVGSHPSAMRESFDPSSSRGGAAEGGSGGGGVSVSGSAKDSSDERSSSLRVAKTWDVGQRAARHFLAARAYFAPFEHGPTSVILALDMCSLYLFLAEMGSAMSRRNNCVGDSTESSPASPTSSTGRTDGLDMTVPIPSLPGVDAGERAADDSERDRPGSASVGREGRQLRLSTVARTQCLEGALRSLLDTRSVFADAGVDIRAEDAAPTTVSVVKQQQRLRRLLGSVTESLPKVLQALVRSSVEAESFPSSSKAAFKSMYRTSLVAMRAGGVGAQAMLATLAKEYGAVEVGNSADGD